MSDSGWKPPAWLLPVGLGVVVVGLVVLALARGPVTLDPDSAEGTVQEYLIAINDERWDDAIEVVHEDWRGACVGADLRSFDPEEFSAELGAPGDAFRGVIEEQLAHPEADDQPAPTLPEETTTVDVTISHGGTGGWDEFTTFELVDEDGFWWLVGDPWPYFIWSCRDQ